ncbi:GNAT family N-acetyltransferase [Candidatus Zixiibacteriota bacterium]
MEYAIVPMTEDERTAVVDIFNYYIEHGFAAYWATTVGYEVFDRFLALARDYVAVTVKTDAGETVGFAMLRAFHPADSFRHTAEITYFISPAHTGQGLGTRLLDHLSAAARAMEITILLASISSRNEGSIRFHQKHGFIECGRFRGIGCKRGQTFDMVWMQKEL